MLDCGHEKGYRGDNPEKLGKETCAAGYATTPDGQTLCYTCADEREREAFAKAKDFFAYLSSDGSRLTTWTGGTLASVTSEQTRRHNFGGQLTYLRAASVDGSRWYGTTPGRGMYARIHRAKHA